MTACEHCGTYTHAPIIVRDQMRRTRIVATWTFCSDDCEQAWWAQLHEGSHA